LRSWLKTKVQNSTNFTHFWYTSKNPFTHFFTTKVGNKTNSLQQKKVRKENKRNNIRNKNITNQIC
jgi:hypothetical protein